MVERSGDGTDALQRWQEASQPQVYAHPPIATLLWQVFLSRTSRQGLTSVDDMDMASDSRVCYALCANMRRI